METKITGIPIRLSGPFQAWGGFVVGDSRTIIQFPTKSGVIGLLASCVGLERNKKLEIEKLFYKSKIHVRVDSPGIILKDFHTKTDFTARPIKTSISWREYLNDASFTVVIVPGPNLNSKYLYEHLKRPVYSPFLGRKCCNLSEPLAIQESVESNSILGLFENIKPSKYIVDKYLHRKHIDFYLDIPYYEKALRSFPQRDVSNNKVKRGWDERIVSHVRVDNPSYKAKES